MIINSSIKNMRTVILPQNCYPVALFFKDGGGLANHPLSCHLQGVFGGIESERKGEKMREKEKKGKLELFAPKVSSLDKKSPLTVCTNGLYSHQDNTNYQNQQKQLTVIRTK